MTTTRPHPTLSFLLIVILAACGGESEPGSAGSPGEAGVAAGTAVAPPSGELLKNGRRPLDGLITGGQPSAEELERLAALGYRSAINLRMPEEPGLAPDDVEGLGMSYAGVPIAGAEGLTRESVERFSAALEAAERPTVVYCGSGNRVGALFALEAYWIDGASPEEALELGRRAGMTRLEPAVREILGLED